MATAATQLGHLTFLTDSSVLLFPPGKQATPLAQRHLFPHLSLLSHSSFLGYSSFSSLSFPVNHKVLSPMGGLPISITLDMLSFQRNSAEVQVIKAGAYCVRPPCAANGIIKYSWRGKPVMISVKNVSFISFEGFFPFFTTKHTISPQLSLQLSKAERACRLKEGYCCKRSPR